MEVYKFKRDTISYFFFKANRNTFVISGNVFCSVDHDTNDYIHLETYELLFDEDIDESLNILNEIKGICDRCIGLKECSQQYKFLEEKEELFNYLKELKKTKRIGEFAEE